MNIKKVLIAPILATLVVGLCMLGTKYIGDKIIRTAMSPGDPFAIYAFAGIIVLTIFFLWYTVYCAVIGKD